MKRIQYLINGLTAVAAIGLASNIAIAQSSAPSQQLRCDTGPVTEIYGKTSWLVYSCSDDRSIVVLAAPGNPATPFYFIVHPSAQGYQIEGEGTGNGAITDAAVADLKTLNERDIVKLIELTKQPKRSD